MVNINIDWKNRGYALICVRGLILIVCGAYTYARVPAGSWVQEW